MSMFDPESLSSLRSQPKEVALEAIKSCFLEICVQLGEIGDVTNPSCYESYINWLKTSIDERVNHQSPELMKAFNASVSLLEMHEETIRSIQQEVRALLHSMGDKGNIGNSGRSGGAIEYNQFIESDFKNALTSNNVESAYRCEDCGSTNTFPRPLISHSASVESLIQLFTFHLPDLTNLKVLDIGSGLGSILYGAYYFSKAKEILGIELNKDTCDILESVISQHRLKDRIKIINADLLTQAGLFQEADVTIFNNVLEYFAPLDVQKKVWLFLRENVKVGSIFVTHPDLKTLLEPLGLVNIIDEWVVPLDPAFDTSVLMGFPETDEKFCMYRVNH